MAKKMLTIGKTLPCRVCETTQPHTHGGIQEFPHNGKRYILWTCCVCGDTRSERIYDAADFTEREQEYARMGTGRM